ncbi:MAG TPA: DnaA/Hda family protein, partial [Caldilineaceae bacterium]|nr:DnaA/Hda family protein [Caldilineaceae bacterium]
MCLFGRTLGFYWVNHRYPAGVDGLFVVGPVQHRGGVFVKYYASTPSEEDYSAVSRHVSTRRTSGGYEVRQSSWSGSDAARPETPRDHMTGPLFPTRTPADGDMPDEEGAHPAMSQADPHSIWQMLLGELELEMPSSTFNTWVRDTWVLGYEDGEFLIGLPNAYARDWLENRLRFKIKRALASMMQRQVQVRFQIVPRPVLDPAVAKPAPLYETIVEPPARVESAPAPRRSVDNSQLNPNHTFDTFVVGNYNRLAHAAATAVAEKPGQSYNPLFIYGGVGLGKTHLLHAIGNHAYKFGCSVLYCSSEQFTNELIAAIRSQTTERFRDKYREVGLLLIDDIQFIGGKESTQEEFFHTFNHLHAAGRQVVLSSDRPPKALATLEERLRSRFEGGLLTDISQ